MKIWCNRLPCLGIECYKNRHLPMLKGDSRAALAFFMNQFDLPEVEIQPAISVILSGN